MSTFQCASCTQTFQSKGQLDRHRQDEHQMSVVVKYFDGTIIKVDREIETRKFNCPRCNTPLSRPKAIQRHALRDCRRKRMKTYQKRAIATVNSDDASNPALLRDMGLYVHVQARVLVCTSCQFVVGPESDQVHSHLTRIHFPDFPDRAKVPSIEQLGKVLRPLNLASESDILTYRHGVQAGEMQPISGLPIFNGEMCETCNYMCRDERTMKNHLASHQGAAASTPVSLQTFFSGTRRRFFRVSPPRVTEDTASMSDSIREELEKFHAFQSITRSDVVSERLIDPLLRQLRWHKKLPTYTDLVCSDLVNMCRVSKESRTDQNLFEAVSHYFEEGMKTIDTIQYVTKRYIIAGGTNVSSEHTGFGFVEDASKTYRRHMTKLIHMVAVCANSDSDTPVWNFDVPDDVGSAVMHLQRLCSVSWFVADSEEVQGEISNVLEALYVTESTVAAPSARDDFQRYSIYRYVVCSSITGGELERITILETNSITSICAAFVYWGRLYTAVKIASKSADVEHSDFYYIRDGVPTSYNAIVEIMKLGKKLSGPAEGQNPIVHWLDDDMTSLVCRTATITKAELSKMASSVSSSIAQTLQQKLLRGFCTDNAKAQIESAKLIDDINSRVDGCWFMDKPENQLRDGPQDLLAFLGSKECNYSLWSESSNGWNIGRVKKWLGECDEFMDDMVILIHLTFGQPARASELATLRLRDGNMAFRSVYAIRNRFSIIQVYHKSMNVTGKFKPIARFAPACLNGDIILYFYLVRPVQAYLVQVAYSGQTHTAQSYLDYVFVKAGSVMSAERMRRSIAKGFAKFSDMKLDVSSYRHVASALIDPHFRDQRLSDDLLDEQAGHSHETASTAYARSDNDPSSLSRDQLHKFWDGSRRWHHFLGLHGDEAVTDRTMNSATDAACTCKSAQMPNLMVALSKMESQVQYLRMEVATRSCKSVSDERQLPSISPQAFAIAKAIVQAFLGTSSGSFLSVEQGVSLSLLISEPRKHRIIILPTGGGKSILYMAPFIADSTSSMTSIVIVPTSALLNESVVKSNLRKIMSCKYNSDLKNTGSRFRLVFAAIEHVGQDDFREYVALLSAKGFLHSIFIDEAHLVVTSRRYRPQMGFMPTLTSIGAPIVLLSATIPIRMEKKLARLFRVEFETIRSKTNRKNISYCVTEVPDIVEATIATIKNHHIEFHGSRKRGIAYCATRREVEELCNSYESQVGLPISGFHSGMEPQQQSMAVAKWKSGRCYWIVATTAFGVGIDYPSVRIVLHVGVAWSMLDYAQETGRAGRDGEHSQALTLTNRAFQVFVSKTVEQHSEGDYTEVIKHLNDVYRCRRQTLQTVLDGYGFPCISDSANALCDVCSRNSSNVTSGITRISHHADLEVEGYARVASRQNSSDRVIQASICEFMERLPSGLCSICWVEGREPVNTSVCCCFHDRCYRCLMPTIEHVSSECDLKLSFSPGNCYVCGLPCMDLAGMGYSMHESYDYKKCSHPAKGFVVSAVWAAFRKNTLRATPTEPKTFSQWLTKRADTSAFTNLVVTFYQLVKQHGPIYTAETARLQIVAEK